MKLVHSYKLFPVILFFMINSMLAQNPEGSWQGVLQIMGQEIRLVFHLENDEGVWKAKMDSPDQGVTGIQVDEMLLDDRQIEMKITAAGIRYTGLVKTDQIIGTFHQAGLQLPLILNKMEEGDEVVVEKESRPRPQDPQPPFPYQEEIVEFFNQEAKIRLEGTLTTPEGAGPFPAVVLITGSGPQNRNSELLGHRPFLVIADHLSRNGIAVFRYDERGVGASEGDFSRATTVDFASDAKAAIEILKGYPNIDPKRTGIVGHSEGGLVAPMVAVQSDDVDFLILMATSGVRGDQLLLEQKKQVEIKMGLDSAMVVESLVHFANAYKVIVSGKLEGEDLKKGVKEALQPVLGPSVPEAQTDALIAQLLSPWMKFFIRHDPAEVLKKVDCPVLAFNGDLDLQVSAEINLRAIEQALKEGNHPQIDTQLFEGLNHLFQTANTGLPTEYELIEETFAPEVMELMVKWIKNLD